MIEQDIRAQIKQAMLNKDELAKNVLRVVLGQIQQEGSSKELNEADKTSIVRKILKSNMICIEEMQKENRELSNDASRIIELNNENVILKGLLPLSWDRDKLKEFVMGMDLGKAKSSGQAIGMVMKELKAAGAVVENDDVREVVVNIFELPK